MIVQPASLGPSGKPRRVLRIVGLVVPVLLLGGVVAAGVLGPAPDRLPPSTAPAIAVGLAGRSTRPRQRRRPSGRARRRGLPVDGRRPRRARRPVHARGAQPGHRPGSRRGRGLPRARRATGQPAWTGGSGIFGPFCERIAVLGEDPWYGAANNGPDAPGIPSPPAVPRRRAHAVAGDQRGDLAIHRDAAGRDHRAVQRPAGEAVRAGWSPLRAGAGRRAGRVGRRHGVPTTPT